MRPPAARPWTEPPWSYWGRISGTYRCESPTLRGQHAVRYAKPWLFRGRPDTRRRWSGSNLVGRRVVRACGAPLERHVSASTRTPQSVLDILENPSLSGSRSIDATVRFCDDKIETNWPRVDRTDVRPVLARMPSSQFPAVDAGLPNLAPSKVCGEACEVHFKDGRVVNQAVDGGGGLLGIKPHASPASPNCRWIPASLRRSK
jgi:hypothetical protein